MTRLFAIHLGVFFITTLFFSGCAPGIIYTDITTPLTTNMQQTPVGIKVAEINSQHIRIPVPRARVGAEWSSQAIGDAAKKGGLEKIHYAEMRTLSVLAGTWRKQTIRVWGE